MQKSMKKSKKIVAILGLGCYNKYLHGQTVYQIISSSEEVFGLPNIKSAKKRVLVNATKAAQNKAAKSALKTDIKKFEAAVAEGNGLLHQNTAARKKSAMTLKLNKLA